LLLACIPVEQPFTRPLPLLRSRLRVSFGPRSRDHESWANPLPAQGGRLSQCIMLKRFFLVSSCCLSRAQLQLPVMSPHNPHVLQPLRACTLSHLCLPLCEPEYIIFCLRRSLPRTSHASRPCTTFLQPVHVQTYSVATACRCASHPVPQLGTRCADGVEANLKQKQIEFLAPNPRSGLDGPNTSGWYGRLHVVDHAQFLGFL